MQMQEPFAGFSQPMSTQRQIHVPQLQPTLGLDKEMTNLDKALHDLEFEAQHSMKLVNQRQQRLELLQQKHVESKMETVKHKTKASEFDDQCKQMHRQFIRNNELTKSFLSSITPSVDHQLRIQKEIESMALEYDKFKNQKKKLLEHYQGILKERQAFCATLPGMETLNTAKQSLVSKETEVAAMKREKSDLQIQKEGLEAEASRLPDFLKSGGAFVVRLAQLKSSSSNLMKEAKETELRIGEKKEELIRKAPGMVPAVVCAEVRASDGVKTSEIRRVTPPDRPPIRSACPPRPPGSSEVTSHYFSRRSAPDNSSPQVPVLTLNMGPAPRAPPPSKSRQPSLPCPLPYKQPKLSLDFGLELQIPSVRVPTRPDPPRTPQVNLPPTRLAPGTPIPDFALQPVPRSPSSTIRYTSGAGCAQTPGTPAILAISPPDTPRPPVISPPKVARPAPRASPDPTHDLQHASTSAMTASSALTAKQASFKKVTPSLLNAENTLHPAVDPQFKVPLPPESPRPTSLYTEQVDIYRQATNFTGRDQSHDSPPGSSDADSTSFHFSPAPSSFSAFGSGEPDSFSFGSSKDQGFGMFGADDNNEDFGFSFGSGAKSPPSGGFGFFGGGDTDDNAPMSFF